MTTKAEFTEEVWARLGRAPLVAGMAISLADPGGPIEAIEESSAATTPEEADQFREWLKSAAQRTALAAKEGA
jgi:hypothetical protein